MSELYNLIKCCQDNDLNSVEFVCNKFMPLLKKYAHKLNYEDAYNDLQVYLIKCIYKIPLNRGNFCLSDMYILSYIKNSVYFGYIELSKTQEMYLYNNKFDYNCDYKMNRLSYKEKLCSMEDELYITDIKKLLNDKEYELFVLKFLRQFSDFEIAKQKGISRQAINKNVNKIKNKLKKYFKV